MSEQIVIIQTDGRTDLVAATSRLSEWYVAAECGRMVRGRWLGGREPLFKAGESKP